MLPWGFLILVGFTLFLIGKLIGLISVLNNFKSEKRDIQASCRDTKIVERFQIDRLKNLDGAIRYYTQQIDINSMEEKELKYLEEAKEKIKNMDSEEYIDYISEEIEIFRKKLISHITFISLPIILSLIWIFMKD